MAGRADMQPFTARLETFQVSHQLGKRRASSQATKKKAANTVEWPHKLPEAKELARAGFYFQPGPGSPDNLQCFFCDVKLDGWEESDVPIREHLAHSPNCQYAQCLNAALEANAMVEADLLSNLDDVNPMRDELVAARRATFETGVKWPHESKKGWKCKVAKMINAGWCFDPAPSAVDDEEPDDVTCFYCNLGLNGWERQDDPAAEHRRRMPTCSFFLILDNCASAKSKKVGGKAGRASTNSKASRISTQSAMSMFSERPSLADAPEELAEQDDSIVTSGTTASQATVVGKGAGKKKGKAKAATKTSKGRSRAGTADSIAQPEPVYPDLSHSQAPSRIEMAQPDPHVEIEAPTKPGRKGSRQSKQVKTAETEPVSTIENLPQKPTRGRKATQVSQVPAEPSVQPEEVDQMDQSYVSAQLLEELDRSLSIDLDAKFELDERTPQQAPENQKPMRGTKRTSDGLEKPQADLKDDQDPSVMILDFPPPPAAKSAPKAKKGRKASKQEQSSASNTDALGGRNISESEITQAKIQTAQDGLEPPEVQPSKAPPKAKAPKTRKASSSRSSKSTKSSVATDPVHTSAPADEQNLEQDEKEIEAELARIAAEQAKVTDYHGIQMETDKVDEFEPSPSSILKKAQRPRDSSNHVNAIQSLERELQAEVSQLPNPGTNLATYVKAVARSSLSSKSQPTSTAAAAAADVNSKTPSPSGSDKENVPSSAAVDIENAKTRAASPSPANNKSQGVPVRIPLAAGTPNRSGALVSRSPAKHLSRPTSTVPWEARDLDSILLLASPPHALAAVDLSLNEASGSGTFAARLAGAAGVLPSPERKLTVEQWVRAQAEKGDLELRRKCEEMVARFEREGNRAMASLGGLMVGGEDR